MDFSRQARQARRQARLAKLHIKLADAFASSPLLTMGIEETSFSDRRALPQEALNMVSEFVQQFQWPVTPQLTYHGMRTATRDEQTPATEADAQILITAQVVTASGVKKEMEIPVFVRGRKLLEPSVAIVDGQPRILAQSLVDELVHRGTFRLKSDPRGHIFGPPLTQEARDLWLKMDDDLKQTDKVSNGMFSVEAQVMPPQQQGTPRVDQVVKEIEAMCEKGYEPIDVVLAIHNRFPTIAEAALQAAKDKGLLEELE